MPTSGAPSFHAGRKINCGMEVSDGKRLNAPEEQNTKLKKLLAERMVDEATFPDMLGDSSDVRFKEERREPDY